MASLLLVDDEPANLLALHAVLEPLGHELTDARSGKDALRLLLDRQFALALLDVRMPEMDGVETASFIRRRDRSQAMPILFLTAAIPQGNDVARAYAEGAADYLVKPIDPDILRAKVQALVGAQEAAVEAAVQARTEELQRRERQARAEAREATRLKDQFLATVSHELRTPLMSILGWARMLRLGKTSADPSARALRTIERSARQQARLIDELLDAQRLASGKMTLAFRDVPFARVIEASLRSIEQEAAEKGVALRVALPAGEEFVVFGDAERLQQAVTVLLRNAVQFTHAGGTVRVILSVEDADLLLTISDDGRGMSAEFLARAFEPFALQEDPLHRDHGGIGLGLYTVRGLVELQGGSVVARSEGDGRGSSLQMTLPLRGRMARLVSPATAARPSEPVHAVSLQGVSILVVDDDPDAQYLIATMLEQFGGRVTAAGSAADAMVALSRGHFALLVSDISMPGEDGYSLVRRVRSGSVNPQIPAVALTANARREDRALALAAGFQAHLAKPIEPGELAATLAALMPV